MNILVHCSKKNFDVINYRQCDGTVQQDKITRPLISRSVWNILKYFMIPPILWSSLARLTRLSYPARFESMKGWVGSMMDACKEEKSESIMKGSSLWTISGHWMTVIKFRYSKYFELFPNRFHFDGTERGDSEENKTGADHLFLMMVRPSLVKEGHVDQIYSNSHELMIIM